jgi:large subunit ribosomal protein L22
MFKHGARAVTKYVRISPQKARLAAGLIRGLSVEQAQAELQYSQLKGGRLLKKTLDSAIANALFLMNVKKDELKVVEVRVDDGPRLKRSIPKNKGGRHPILKRTSHFTVIVNKE